MAEINRQQLGNRIRQARTFRQLTLDELASQIDVNKSTISRYERGEIDRPKLPVIHAIASALHANPSWFVGKSGDSWLEDRADLIRQSSGIWDGIRLAGERRWRGHSPEQMALLLGISESDYLDLESGRSEPTFTTLMRLADIFSSDLDYICHRLSKASRPMHLSTSELDRRILYSFHAADEVDQRIVLRTLQIEALDGKMPVNDVR